MAADERGSVPATQTVGALACSAPACPHGAVTPPGREAAFVPAKPVSTGLSAGILEPYAGVVGPCAGIADLYAGIVDP